MPIKNGGGDDARFWLCCGFVVSVGASVGVGLGVCVGEGTRVIESHAPCSSLMANDGGRIKVLMDEKLKSMPEVAHTEQYLLELFLIYINICAYGIGRRTLWRIHTSQGSADIREFRHCRRCRT